MEFELSCNKDLKFYYLLLLFFFLFLFFFLTKYDFMSD